MAEGLLEKMLRENDIHNIDVFSAGTHPISGDLPSKEAIEILRKEGVDISRHRSSYVTYGLISQVDLILAMGKNHKEKILEMNPEAKDKVFLLKEFAGNGTGDENPDVIDPIGQPTDAYKESLFEIRDALKKSLPKIIEMMEGKDEGSNRK